MDIRYTAKALKELRKIGAAASGIVANMNNMPRIRRA